MRSQRGRGRGGGRGPKSTHTGPALPFKIRKELDVDGSPVSRAPKQRGSIFHVSQRKERRRAARHGPKAALQQRTGEKSMRTPQESIPETPDAMRLGRQGRPADGGFMREPRPATKRHAGKPAGRVAASKKTRFSELLDADTLKARPVSPPHHESPTMANSSRTVILENSAGTSDNHLYAFVRAPAQTPSLQRWLSSGSWPRSSASRARQRRSKRVTACRSRFMMTQEVPTFECYPMYFNMLPLSALINMCVQYAEFRCMPG